MSKSHFPKIYLDLGCTPVNFIIQIDGNTRKQPSVTSNGKIKIPPGSIQLGTDHPLSSSDVIILAEYHDDRVVTDRLTYTKAVTIRSRSRSHHVSSDYCWVGIQ